MKRPLFIFLSLLIIAGFAIIVFAFPGNEGFNQFSIFETIGKPANTLSSIEQIYYSAYVIFNKEKLTSPAPIEDRETRINISEGESIKSISEKLKANGLISDPSPFRVYLIFSGLDTQIQTGEFIISSNLTPVEIAQTLTDPSQSDIDYVILPGWRIEEIVRNIEISGLEFTPESMVDYVYQHGFEGYLLPGIYTVPRDIPMDWMVALFVDSFKTNVTDEMKTGFKRHGLSIEEAVILASIIEREAVVVEEMDMIASVFINRLRAGMGLKADPTVQYALGYNVDQGTWWTNPLSSSDLEIDSPFNTYLYMGLPPTPICNPSLSALQAVAYPAQTTNYFFRAACDNSGTHLFAETFEEHLANSCPKE